MIDRVLAWSVMVGRNDNMTTSKGSAEGDELGATGVGPSRKVLWAGRIVSALPALMLLASGVAKVVGPKQIVEGFIHLGYPARLATPIGILEIVCAVLYMIPQTAVLGAILLTGYLGGEKATHVRVGEPFVMPVLKGMVLWLGLCLREPRLWALMPLRR